MPDPNEIAAAAERLPILEQEIAEFGPVGWDIERYNALAAKINEVRRLSRILAAAYLDEHAAEPVTREWLVGVLGEPIAKNAINWDWRHEFDAIRHSGNRMLGQLGDGVRIIVSIPLETSADVLAFLRLARWPLKGGSDE